MKKMKHLTNILLILFAMSLLLTGCKKEEAESGEVVRTNVALTVQADLTRLAVTDTPTITPTPEATLAPTMQPQTPTSQTPVLQITNTLPSAGTTNAAEWVSNDPADGSLVEGGIPFNAVVTLLNTGDTTWTTSYYIEFFFNEQLGAPDKIYMPIDVPPGKQVEIEVPFVALDQEGTFRSDWYVVSADEIVFYSFYFEFRFG
jgi:hypothetical protein